MASITVRNLPDEVHRALRVRASEHEQSLEAYVREILSATAFPEEASGFGDELRAVWNGEFGNELDDLREKTPHDPIGLT